MSVLFSLAHLLLKLQRWLVLACSSSCDTPARLPFLYNLRWEDLLSAARPHTVHATAPPTRAVPPSLGALLSRVHTAVCGHRSAPVHTLHWVVLLVLFVFLEHAAFSPAFARNWSTKQPASTSDYTLIIPKLYPVVKQL